MTNLDGLGLDTTTARIRYPSGAPAGDEWDGYRPAPSVHRLSVRRLRRRLSAGLRAWEP